MQARFLGGATIGIVVVLFLALLPVSYAGDEPSSVAEATVTATFESPTTLRASCRVMVQEISEIFGGTYDQASIETIAGSDPETMGAIKQRLRDILMDQITAAFPEATVVAVQRPQYVLPHFIDEFRITLTAPYFSLEPTVNTSTFVEGFLDMGAEATYPFSFSSTPGWNTTYTIVLPSSLVMVAASTDNVDDRTQSSWAVRNRNGGEPAVDAQLRLRAAQPTTPAGLHEDLAVQFVLDTRSLSAVSLGIVLDVRAMQVDTYGVLPGFLSGTTVLPADGIRLLVDNGLLSWSRIQNETVAPVLDRLKPLVENSSFNQALTVSFSWDPDTTTACTTPYVPSHMDAAPALRASYVDPDVRLTIGNIGARAFFGLLNAGANATIDADDINFGRALYTIGLPYSIRMTLPQNITFKGLGELSWNESSPLTGSFSSSVQPSPPYTKESGTATITIDIKKTDLSIPSLFSGQSKLVATTTLSEEAVLGVMAVPPSLALPPCMQLSFLNADAYRLCAEEGVLDDQSQTAFFDHRRGAFETRISTVVGRAVTHSTLNAKTLANSLQWDRDISSMDDRSPLVVGISIDEDWEVPVNLSAWPAAFSVAPVHFTIPPYENVTTTYRIMFPAGVSVVATDGLGQAYATGKTGDGREYIEIVQEPGLGEAQAVVSCSLEASPLYIFVLFLPCLLAVVLFVVLLLVIIIVRRRRHSMHRTAPKRKKREVDQEPSGYEEEEFYVPPPPSSRRR